MAPVTLVIAAATEAGLSPSVESLTARKDDLFEEVQMTRSIAPVLLMLALSPVVHGQDAFPLFEVVSIKPIGTLPIANGPGGQRYCCGVFVRRAVTVESLLRFAFSITNDAQMAGGPDWIRKDYFAVEAHAPAETRESEMPLYVRGLLLEKFNLTYHEEEHEGTVVALVRSASDAKPGRSLIPCESRETPPKMRPTLLLPNALPLSGQCVSMTDLAASLGRALKANVVDRTNISGLWSFTVFYADLNNTKNDAVPDLTGALRDELGLKLEKTKGSTRRFIVDRIDRPEEN